MKNLNEMSLTEKKALAYDFMAQMENIRRNLTVLNQAISEEINNPGIKKERKAKKAEKKEIIG